MKDIQIAVFITFLAATSLSKCNETAPGKKHEKRQLSVKYDLNVGPLSSSIYHSLSHPSTQEMTSRTMFSPGVRPGSFLVPGLPDLLATSSRHTISTVNNPVTFELTDYPLHVTRAYPQSLYAGVPYEVPRAARFKVPQPVTFRTGRFEAIRPAPVDVERPVDIYRPVEYLKQIGYPVALGGPVTLAHNVPFMPYYVSTKYQGFNTHLTPFNAPGSHLLSHFDPHIRSKPNPLQLSLNFLPQ